MATFLITARPGRAPPIFAPTNPVIARAVTTEITVTGMRNSTQGPVTARSGSREPDAKATKDAKAACPGLTC